MPTIEGNLNPSTAQSVLDTLINKNPASTWLISDGREEKVIYFSTGGIRLYASEHRKISPLVDFLIQRHLVTKDQLHMAREVAQESRRETLDEVLDRMGFLPRTRFQDATSHLIYLELCDVITWENAIFEFYEGNPPPQIFDQNHPALFATLDVRQMAVRIKEWNHEWSLLKTKLYSERLRIKCLAAPEEFKGQELSSPLRHVYNSMDGQRSIREVSIACGFDFPELARLIRTGLQEGYLRGAMASRKEASSPAEVMEEIEQLEEALDKAINTILIHKRIATGYERIQEKDRASEHYQMVGNLEGQAGRVAKALENFRHALQLSPQNLSAHENLIRCLQDAGEEEKALVEIVALAKKLFNFGFFDRAYDCLRAIIAKVPHLLEVRMLFADILLALGRKSEAVKEYMWIVGDKKKSLTPEQIEDLYRKILSLDPMNREARFGLVKERRRQAGKCVVWIHRITGTAAALLLLAWGVNEIMARCDWGKTEGMVRQSITDGKCSQGFKWLWEFGKRYPASILHSSLPGLEKEIFKLAFFRGEAKMKEAERHLKQGSFSEARRLYREVLEAELVENQIERAREGLKAVDRDRHQYTQLRDNAESLLKNGSYEHAFLYVQKVVERFPASSQNLRIPYFIRTNPAGARVNFNGTLWGYTPVWIVAPLNGRQEVLIEKAGYETQVLGDLTSRSSPYIQLNLKPNPNF